jgi:hypothetical protein
MPSASSAQHKLMLIAAHTPGGYGGVPQKVGKDFDAADKRVKGGFKSVASRVTARRKKAT